MFRCSCVQLGQSLFVMWLGCWRKAAVHYDVVEKSLCHSSQQHRVLIACWKLTVLIIVITWLHSGLCCQTSAVKVDGIAVRQCVCTVTVLLTVALEFHMDFSKTAVIADIFIMAAMHSRCRHYVFVLWFLFFLSSFFPHLFSAIAYWMSTILPYMMWP